MSLITAGDVKIFIIEKFQDPLLAKGLTPESIPDDFDLLTEGIIDSLGFMELIAAIGERFGVEIDFEEMDPEQITIVGPFCRYVEQKGN
jgi:acyl carrier protein